MRNLLRFQHRYIRAKEWGRLMMDASLAWYEDNALSMGAAISFYTIFSAAPLLIIATAVSGFFFGDDAASGQVFVQARGLVGAEGAAALQALIESARRPTEGVIATITAIAIMIIGAAGVFAELQGAMDRIWKAPLRKSQSGFLYFLRQRLWSFGMVMSVAFLSLVSLVFGAVITALSDFWQPHIAQAEVLLHSLNIVVSFVLVATLFALMFKMLPRVSVAWIDVAGGAIVTAVLFEIGKFLIGLYIGMSGVTSSFGAAGTLAALLLWIYYSTQTFLLGAEFTWIYAERYGSRSGSPVK